MIGIAVAGVANWTEVYSKFSVVNPILVANQAMANTVMQFNNMPIVREGGIAIIVHPLTAQFDARRFAPYQEFWDKLLPQDTDPYWLWTSTRSWCGSRALSFRKPWKRRGGASSQSRP